MIELSVSVRMGANGAVELKVAVAGAKGILVAKTRKAIEGLRL